MKKAAILLATAALFAFRPVADQAIWTSDKAHANLKFTITHLMVNDVEGSFKNFESKITGTKDDFSDAVVEMSADVASINTDNEQRDTHLKGADFFDAEKFPKLTFKSVTFKKVEDKKYKIVGNLTMHGVTRSVTLEATLKGPAEHPMSKKQVAGFKVTGTIKRSDFGLGTSFPSTMLSDEVAISSNAEFIKN